MVLSIAFLIAVTMSTIIAVMIGAEALPLKELRNDVLLAVFIGLVQLIWIGSVSYTHLFRQDAGRSDKGPNL